MSQVYGHRVRGQRGIQGGGDHDTAGAGWSSTSTRGSVRSPGAVADESSVAATLCSVKLF